MSYLSRESSPLSEELWSQIDSAVIEAARKVLTGRCFLHIFGPSGIGTEYISIDDEDSIEEVENDGLVTTRGRRFVEIPLIYDDFTLLARDLESAKKSGLGVDLHNAARAAEECAIKEDRLIFFGNSKLGYDGLVTSQGTKKIAKGDWSAGENAFVDIASGIEHFTESGIYGTYALTVSPDLYMQLQRLQPGTGMLEADRVAKMLNGHLYVSRVLGKEKAVLTASDQMNMDLVIGQDIATAYLEQRDLNHCFRVLETVLLRIKRRQAVVVFE